MKSSALFKILPRAAWSSLALLMCRLLSCRLSAFPFSSGRRFSPRKHAPSSFRSCYQHRPSRRRRLPLLLPQPNQRPHHQKVPATGGLQLLCSLFPHHIVQEPRLLRPLLSYAGCWSVAYASAGVPSSEAAQPEAGADVPAFRARSLSEDTVRIHPSPAPSAAGPFHLDSAVLRQDDPATATSQLMVSQQALQGSDRESGCMPSAPQQSMPAAGLMANLSEPGVLASLLQKGAPPEPYCCGLQCNVSEILMNDLPDLHQPEQQDSKSIHHTSACCISMQHTSANIIHQTSAFNSVAFAVQVTASPAPWTAA